MKINEKTIGLLESKMTKSAMVLGVRAWTGKTFYEMDLHIPDATFEYNKVLHMKCRVAQMTYRNYSISMWDAETQTCTLFIDAAHDGLGSAWVKTLQRNDSINYFNIEGYRHSIQPGSQVLFLGDQSAIGHFLALQQVAGAGVRIAGAIVIPRAVHRTEFKAYYPDLNLDPIAMGGGSVNALAHWMDTVNEKYDMVYVAGNTHMVVAIRQQLKVIGYTGAQINAQGFWK